MRFPLCFEATTSRSDFVRLLPRATRTDAIVETPEGFSGPGWRLRVTPIAPLEIGLVRLERHRIELQFQGLSEHEQDDFMRCFTHHYQRGGG